MFELTPFGHRAGNLSNSFDHFEKAFFGDLADSFSAFKTDILDQGDQYILQAELPGFAKEDIAITTDEGRLTIMAEHQEDHEEKQDNFVRRERSYGSFRRSFDISGIQADAITASYDNGVLTLKLPKAEEQKRMPKRINIR